LRPTFEQGECAIDTYKLLDEVESLVEEGKHVFGLTMISREDFFELTNKLRASLPEEMRRANKVNQDSERIVGGAREAAEQTVVDAKSEAQRVLDSSHQYAEKLVRDTEAKIHARLQDADALAQKNIAEARAVAHQTTHEAKLAAEKVISEASRRADHLVNDSEIMRLAAAQAKEIVATAEADAKDMRRGADEFAREELTRLERVLSEATSVVSRGRMKLDQRVASHDGAPPTQSKNGSSNGDMAGARR
jgi:cell division septum initiation protein DivIVA